MQLREPHGVVALDAECTRTVGQVGGLEACGAERGPDLGDIARDGVPLRRQHADAERARLGDDASGEVTRVSERCEHREQGGGASLLHDDGGEPDIERASLQQPFGGHGDLLGGEVVEVRLEYDDVIGRFGSRSPRKHRHTLGRPMFARAAAGADAPERHRGECAERRGERSDERRAGGCRELAADAARLDRDALEQTGCGGSGTGSRPCAVLTVPLPSATGETIELLDAERVQAKHDAEYVDDRVGRADLVEMHLLGGHAMYGRLRMDERFEYPKRVHARRFRYRSAFEGRPDVCRAATRRRLLGNGEADGAAGVAGDVDRHSPQTR